jgi:hypothetical protein
MRQSTGRIGQAIKILKVVWENRRDTVVLLSYDPLLMPLVSLLKKKILVFEHNTTPRKGLSKHLVWQKLFFGRVHRMAQFPGQYDRLLRIVNNTTYIGSPVFPVKTLVQDRCKSMRPYLFIVPSYRAVMSELNRYAHLLHGSIILAKKTVGSASIEVESSCSFTIQYIDRIEFCYGERMADAVIITVQSSIRGTGWFNDSISNRTPIVIINKDAKVLFEETFPGYPFIFLDNIESLDRLDQLLNQLIRFDSPAYARSHNASIRTRFFDMCSALGIHAE